METFSNVCKPGKHNTEWNPVRGGRVCMFWAGGHLAVLGAPLLEVLRNLRAARLLSPLLSARPKENTFSGFVSANRSHQRDFGVGSGSGLECGAAEVWHPSTAQKSPLIPVIQKPEIKEWVSGVSSAGEPPPHKRNCKKKKKFFQGPEWVGNG